MDQLEFPPHDILEFIQGKLDFQDVTIRDINSPSAAFVQKVYWRLLSELGVADTIISSQVEFNVLDDVGEHVDIYKTMLPILSLQAAIVNVLSQITGETNFGISDLIDPLPKRTRKFFSALQNFWTFSDSMYHHVEESQKEIDGLLQAKKNFQHNIELYKVQINNFKSRAVLEEEKIQETRQEIDHLTRKTNEMMLQKEELEEVKGGLKKDLETGHLKIQELKEQVNKVEMERNNLQGVVDGAAAIQRLTEEQSNLRRDLDDKETLLRDNAEKLITIEQAINVLKSILEEVHKYCSEQGKIKNFDQRLREINRDIEAINVNIDEFGNLIRDEDSQVKEKVETLNKIKNKWSRRCQGKQEELDRAEAELEEAKSHFNDEQLREIEFTEKIGEIQLECEEVNDTMRMEANQVRSQYTRILEAIEKFNKKMSSNMSKLNEYKDKLSNGAA